jgi:HAE1 family hydrophobic/amphiphilic exporter-1
MEKVNALAATHVPGVDEGYYTKWQGQGDVFEETFRNIIFAFGLAVVLTYMVLGAQFESFGQPLVIMIALPLSFVGAFGALYLFRNTLNIFSMIGMVLLVGLATKNGILLVDFINQARASGMSRADAIVQAGATRLRPILMTAFSTVAGVLPVAIGIGEGSEIRQPMALATAGGIASSTLLTLLVVPVIYTYIDGITAAVRRAFRFLAAEKPPEPAIAAGSNPDAEAVPPPIPEPEKVKTV